MRVRHEFRIERLPSRGSTYPAHVRGSEAGEAVLTQGQGSSTEFKERGIAAALKVSLSLANKPSYRYWHCDLNAGSGYNEVAQCIGSPLAFLQSALDSGRTNFQAYFCDHDEKRVIELTKRIGPDKRCFCLPWENKEVLPVLAELITKHERNPQYAWGTIIVDPNGYFGDGVPHAELIDFARRFPRMDVVLNLNTRTYRLGKALVEKLPASAWGAKFWPSPRMFPELFGRKHWLIRNVIQSKGDSFVLMVGRNYRAGDHTALGMYHLGSRVGQEILDAIDGTTTRAGDISPLQDLPGLFDSPGLQSGPNRGDDQGQLFMPELRGGSD